MADRIQTRKMGVFDMAAASDRILSFWEKYPDGKILVKDNSQYKKPDDLLVKKAFIWKKKKDYLTLAAQITIADREIVEDILTGSSDANAEARQAEGKEAKKDFEKLETIAIGRALAALGFLKDGQVASSEEMENYNEYLQNKIDQETIAAIEYLNEAETLEDLGKRWIELDGTMKQVDEIVERKNLLKQNFLNKEKKETLKKDD